MNRIDRQNLSALTDSVSTAAPIGLNTTTGAPDLSIPASRPAASLADDATVANSSHVIEPKPGSKFACPEDFGTIPVGMNNHGDYTGPGLAPRPGSSDPGRTTPAQDQIIAPKPGSKFARPDEDEDDCGVLPAPLSLCQPEGNNTPPCEEDPLAEEEAFRRYPDARPPVMRPRRNQQPPQEEQPRPTATVPDDMSLPNSNEIITPKPGSKFAAAQTRR